MRAVVAIGPGELELNYMMLPTFIGMNATLKKEIELALKPKIEGQPWTDGSLDQAHDLVVDFLVKRFAAIPGLRDYLEALKYVTDR